MSCHAMPCHAMLCYVMLCYVMLCYVMLCYAMLCYANYVMLCYAMLCYVMLCYVMLCYVMLCYVMLWVTSTLAFSSTITIHQLKNLSTLFSFAFISLISKPTRPTSYSATLIHITFTNNLSQNVLNGVVLSDLSDHLPVFAYFFGQTLTRHGNNKAFTRKFTDENLRKFNENVSNTICPHFLTKDPNVGCNNFCVPYTTCIATLCCDLIYLFLYLFICLRESSACHVV